MNNLNAEFFKLIGWKKDYYWYSPITPKEIHLSLPNPAGDWRDFHKWVVPELVARAKTPPHLEHIERITGTLFCSKENKTPEAAIKWAMEEIND